MKSFNRREDAPYCQVFVEKNFSIFYGYSFSYNFSQNHKIIFSSQIFGMINEYNINQMKINSSFNQEIEVIKRKSENGDDHDDEENFCVKKSKADESSNDIFSKHAKYFK